jgi:hypothetical protein
MHLCCYVTPSEGSRTEEQRCVRPDESAV